MTRIRNYFQLADKWDYLFTALLTISVTYSLIMAILDPTAERIGDAFSDVVLACFVFHFIWHLNLRHHRILTWDHYRAGFLLRNN